MIEKLKGKLPVSVLAELPAVMEKFQINTPLRLAHFLAQCDHESGGFKATTENLNYSADRLLVVFPKYFKNINEANAYARNPKKIASRVYANRYGNSDEASQDGYLYRGRTFVQLTFKANYEAFGKAVGEDFVKNPDLVNEKYALVCAGWFWNNAKINPIADKGTDINTITAVRKKINGGDKGLLDVQKLFTKYYNLLK